MQRDTTKITALILDTCISLTIDTIQFLLKMVLLSPNTVHHKMSKLKHRKEWKWKEKAKHKRNAGSTKKQVKKDPEEKNEPKVKRSEKICPNTAESYRPKIKKFSEPQP